MTEIAPVRRALISVSDKTGVVAFARELVETHGVEVLSTGGTAAKLREAGVPVVDVVDYTGAPEIMGGRVKTLHPRIHGGILGRRAADADVMRDNDIPPIDMVVVNLYPFEQTVAAPDTTRETAIETIDIGGPAMLRAAAKNHADVTLVVDPADGPAVLAEIGEHGGTTTATRRRLAAAGFAHTAGYDRAIAAYLGADQVDGGEDQSSGDADATMQASMWSPQAVKVDELRYGENPHQQAAVYRVGDRDTTGVVNARLCQGKALSYNNYADADAALAAVRDFDDTPACVIIKHANPCGIGVGPDLATAYARAFATDPASAFGGIIAFNDTVDGALAGQIVSNQFAEVVLAPAFADDALGAFGRRKNLRVLATGAFHETATDHFVTRSIQGGFLRQQADAQGVDSDRLENVGQATPDGAQIQDMFFAFRAAKHVKSNAIVFAARGQTLGVGAGQMSRIDAVRIARQKAADAGLDLTGSVMASDAFFPFRDGVDAAVEAGVAGIIQPGGSKRDDEVIAAADEAGVAMMFTGLRHFRH